MKNSYRLGIILGLAFMPANSILVDNESYLQEQKSDLVREFERNVKELLINGGKERIVRLGNYSYTLDEYGEIKIERYESGVRNRTLGNKVEEHNR